MTAPSPPVQTGTPPVISGTAEVGQTLTASNGEWTENPTSFAYQWQRCNSGGTSCAAISGATEKTYKAATADVGSTLRVAVTASNAAGPSSPASSEHTAVVTAPSPPVQTGTPPVISGTAEVGQTLTASNGEWTESPTKYAYQWQRCNSGGTSCAAISGATEKTYKAATADVGSTLRVAVTASNAAGPSSPASSEHTAVIQSAQAPQTFGTTTVGGSSDTFAANRKRVNRYALSTAGSVSKLSIYLAPTSNSGQQLIEGVVYAESAGAPTTLLGTSTPLTFKSTNVAGWYELNFATPLSLAAGNYWIGIITGESSGVAGFRYTSVTNSRDYNTNTYTSGPSNPFGTPTTDSEEMSIYATYSTAGPSSPPGNVTKPNISGTAEVGQTLTASNGEWTENPTSFAYQWQRCNSGGTSCAAISGATEKTYKAATADVGSTLRVAVTASNAAGPSSPASSEHTAVVTAPSPPVQTGTPPVISGTAEVGQTLTASNGEWTENPTSFAYQWQRCNSGGTSCAAISGATEKTYKAATADVGSTLRVAVTASNAAGPSSPASSEHTAVVASGSEVLGSLTPLSPLTVEVLTEPIAVVVSPDGRFVYVGYEFNQSISEFSRNTETGALTPLSPATVETAAPSRSIAISPDGKSFYVTDFTEVGSSKVSQFSRNTETGKLTPLSPATVESGTGGHGIVVSPNGKSVYVTNYYSESISQYSRNTETGALTPLSPATVSTGKNPDGIVMSNDGKFVYVPNRYGESVSQYSRNSETGALTPLSPATVAAGEEVHGIAISPDNKSVYVANAQSETVSQYSRNAETGKLTPLSPATIKTGLEPFEIGVSADDRSVYVTNDGSKSISEYSRNTETGALTPLSPASIETGEPYGITISPDGRTVYVANKGTKSISQYSRGSSSTSGSSGTFGKTTVGASSDTFASERKRVNRYALSEAASVTKLSIYLQPTGNSGQQVLKGVIYADSGGAPAALLGVSEQLTFNGTESAGWYELRFSSAVKLSAGNYWIGVMTGPTSGVAGFRYDSVASSRDYNTNTYASGPTNPFGAVSTDSEQMSLYASYE